MPVTVYDSLRKSVFFCKSYYKTQMVRPFVKQNIVEYYESVQQLGIQSNMEV